MKHYGIFLKWVFVSDMNPSLALQSSPLQPGSLHECQLTTLSELENYCKLRTRTATKTSFSARSLSYNSDRSNPGSIPSPDLCKKLSDSTLSSPEQILSSFVPTKTSESQMKLLDTSDRFGSIYLLLTDIERYVADNMTNKSNKLLSLLIENCSSKEIITRNFYNTFD